MRSGLRKSIDQDHTRDDQADAENRVSDLHSSSRNSPSRAQFQTGDVMKHDSKDSSPKRQDKMPLSKPEEVQPEPSSPARTQREADRILDQEQLQSGDEKHNRDRV